MPDRIVSLANLRENLDALRAELWAEVSLIDDTADLVRALMDEERAKGREERIRGLKDRAKEFLK